MKTVEIIGFKRANLGKSESRRLRLEGNVPCVIYGGEEQVHFHAPMYLFRDLVYSDRAHFVTLNIEGDIYQAIMQDIQFHPVSEVLLHVDFLQLFEGKFVKMDIPVHFEGTSPGVTKGGTLIKKRRYLKIKALPKNMPEFIEVRLEKLDFGRSIKVGEINEVDFEILDPKIASVAVVEIPRALRGKTAEEEAEELEEEMAAAEAAEGAEGAEGAAEESAES
ncbi:50S ribosomal protein L25/general stress protein Ctc [Fulvivirga sedimenti]|uniref:Large ribosomal subunit protein bL25 n=1 Tax=Fulvivirga sedimenti TaxID=2879465 RepID=A0A9X1KX33_9BACT|nr:50S ribosomal protein L25/general stress protein Ctc [Fulvivirga sedimenti]MCA6075425.1 50S ribosomal protein L25/general stress protein Ctc [Fulvivirga sedimenti]MCA6076602.1 50S ribosomal protein L25/general stress protein Ctc [Fulvivirga sedimenti]MCA6077730.1 50S ribosomal protein L25/general stress protein Ctc [Fulvivirga sedimenti]